MLSQLLGMTIWDWKWRSDAKPAAFEPWADIVGSLLVSPALLLPPLAALLVLFQHRANLPSVLKPTHLWRKNALKQNKKDKYLGEKRIFRYKLNGTDLEREVITDPVITALDRRISALERDKTISPLERNRRISALERKKITDPLNHTI